MKKPNRGWMGTMAIVVGVALAPGCGPALVHMGADVAGGSVKSGTQSVARGSNPSACDAAGLAVGVGLMVAGHQLTQPDQRQNAHPMPTSFYNGAPPPPTRN